MNFDLLRLKNGIDKKIIVDEIYSFNEEQLKGTDVSKLDNVHINGEITLNALGDIYLSLEVNGVMIIPCAVTLKPVEYPFNIIIEGDLSEISEENEEKFINSIDILPIIWENILMEIPMRVVSEGAEEVHLEGDGWKLVTDKDSVKETNPALAKLKDLL